MAKPPIEIIVTPRDEQKALNQNWKRAKSRLSNPLVLSNFVHENFEKFEKILGKYNLPDNYTVEELLDNSVDALRSKTRKDRNEAKKFLLNLIDRNKSLFDPTSVKIKVVDPEEFATRRANAKERDRQKNEIRWNAIKRDVALIADKSISLAKFTAKLTGTVSALPFVGLYKTGKGAKGAVDLMANGLSVLFNVLKVPMGVRATLLGISVVGTTGFALGPAPIEPPKITIANIDPAVAKKLPIIAAYDAAFAPTEKTSARNAHAYASMKAGEKVGIPAIALHLVSYFETNGFDDVLAGSSSASKMTASSPFQIINTTKISYMRQHGNKTPIYLEAKEKVENGTGSDLDKSIVFAVDEFSKHSEAKLLAMYKDRKMEGPILDAMRLMDNGAFSAQVIGLDMAKKYPKLLDPNITPDEILDITVEYYTKDHFLGAGGYNKLRKLEKNNPALLLSKAGMGEVVSSNPVFFKKGMTVGDAFESIHDTFKSKVAKPLNVFKAEYKIEMVKFQEEQKHTPDAYVQIQAPPIRTRWDVTVDTFEKLGILTAKATEIAYDSTLGALFADAQEAPAKPEMATPSEKPVPVYVDTIVPKAKPHKLGGPKPSV